MVARNRQLIELLLRRQNVLLFETSEGNDRSSFSRSPMTSPIGRLQSTRPSSMISTVLIMPKMDDDEEEFPTTKFDASDIVDGDDRTTMPVSTNRLVLTTDTNGRRSSDVKRETFLRVGNHAWIDPDRNLFRDGVGASDRNVDVKPRRDRLRKTGSHSLGSKRVTSLGSSSSSSSRNGSARKDVDVPIESSDDGYGNRNVSCSAYPDCCIVDHQDDSSSCLNSPDVSGFETGANVFTPERTSSSSFSLAPCVIVSDHSSNPGRAIESDNGDDYLKMLLDYKSSVMGRKTSTCSTCSTISCDYDDGNESTCSSWGDTDDSGGKSEMTSPKPSAWRKVRNIVHWSPFIQTYKNQKYRWVQLAGHQGNFRAGEQGTILKKLCNREDTCLQDLMKDVLRPYVPDYKGKIECDEGKFVRLQDLLADFDNPCVMDIKMGVRTYLEEELAKAKEKTKLRKDMYEKMVQIDPDEPTEEEHKVKAVTKPRYMLWRETISSTASLGFRIEGIKKGDGTSSKDFKTVKKKEQVADAVLKFAEEYPHAIMKYSQKLLAIRAMLENSDFFKNHELIGSSLLFVHDKTDANIWLIDFAKTLPLPDGIAIDHKSPWIVGNHEDGYLIGLDNLISIFGDIPKVRK